jgi:hypothetical protein
MRLLPIPPFPPPTEMTRRDRRRAGTTGRRTGSSGTVLTSFKVGASAIWAPILSDRRGYSKSSAFQYAASASDRNGRHSR